METNAIAYLFWLPFIAARAVVKAFLWIPWPFNAMVLAVIVSGLLFVSLTDAGPMRIAVLARRFSWLGVPLAFLVGWWCWCAVVFWLHPNYKANAVLWSATTMVLLLVTTVFLERVVMRGHLSADMVRRAYRRMRFRLRWDSIARSLGMAHERDVRPYKWWLGGTHLTRLRAMSVQWTPCLWHGRRGPHGTTQYLMQPARGLSAKQWTDESDDAKYLLQALALAAGAHSAGIMQSQHQGWYTLTLFWTDPSANRPRI